MEEALCLPVGIGDRAVAKLQDETAVANIAVIVFQAGIILKFGDGTVTNIDGIRVDFVDGWGLIRASNTSPVLSLRFEADTEEALARIKGVFAEQLANIDPSLSLS